MMNKYTKIWFFLGRKKFEKKFRQEFYLGQTTELHPFVVVVVNVVAVNDDESPL